MMKLIVVASPPADRPKLNKHSFDLAGVCNGGGGGVAGQCLTQMLDPS